jgi:hypothetical protein
LDGVGLEFGLSKSAEKQPLAWNIQQKLADEQKRRSFAFYFSL